MAKMDWLGMEKRIRGCLKTAHAYGTNPAYANMTGEQLKGDLALLLLEIGDIIGQETGRGYIWTQDEAKAFLTKFGVEVPTT